MGLGAASHIANSPWYPEQQARARFVRSDTRSLMPSVPNSECQQHFLRNTKCRPVAIASISWIRFYAFSVFSSADRCRDPLAESDRLRKGTVPLPLHVDVNGVIPPLSPVVVWVQAHPSHLAVGSATRLAGGTVLFLHLQIRAERWESKDEN